MHLGDGERVQRIVQAWAAGDEVRGLALYWDMVYGYLAGLLASDANVRSAALVVRFETMCAAPVETLRAVLEHCQLADSESVALRLAPGIRYSKYYPSNFSPEDFDIIQEETGGTASWFGY